MRKFIIGLVLAVMTIFSLNAETLKERYVNNLHEGEASVCILSDEVEVGTRYYVIWFELDGSDVVSTYYCNSIERAFNVWLMDRDSIESNRQIYDERVEDIDGKLYLVRDYDLRNNK